MEPMDIWDSVLPPSLSSPGLILLRLGLHSQVNTSQLDPCFTTKNTSYQSHLPLTEPVLVGRRRLYLRLFSPMQTSVHGEA